MWKKYNANPLGKSVGDCTIRAISKALHKSWEEVYVGLCDVGLEMCDMPSANAMWGAYLRRHGFNRSVIPNSCPDCYTVNDFCNDHPIGTYILALSGHVVASSPAHCLTHGIQEVKHHCTTGRQNKCTHRITRRIS